ncbi:hypothetical protein ACFWD7_57960 [Streptomyces mirabilis]|uniref:hypothetical protein n=1 Tax=Streptomyces mirabilis TaxID=68239 RepID=UPI0036D01FB5
MAYHLCFVPDGQRVTLNRLITAAGPRWPVEEDFEFGKDLFGLDQSQVRLYEAVPRALSQVRGISMSRRRADELGIASSGSALNTSWLTSGGGCRIRLRQLS